MCMITQSSATTGIESLNNVNMSILQSSKEINELFCNLTPHAAHCFPYLIFFYFVFNSSFAMKSIRHTHRATNVLLTHSNQQLVLPSLRFSQSNCFNDMCVPLELANISFISLLLTEKWWKTFTTLSSNFFMRQFM